jgi:hypothetical protein
MVDPHRSARCALAQGSGIDEVSTVEAEDRPSPADAVGLFLLGRDLEVEDQARGVSPHVL